MSPCENREKISGLIKESFSNLTTYMDQFNGLLLLYTTDLATNFQDLETLTNVQELRRFCERYTGQMKDIREIVPKKIFGIFELDQRCFHHVMTPLYEKLYGKICLHLPKLLSDLLIDANESCQEIMGTLLTPPDGTIGFVEYLEFLEHCQAVFDDVAEKLETVDQLLKLIEDYQIKAEADLWKRFKTLAEFLVNCKDAHSKKWNQRQSFIEKLSNCIDKDVYQVYQEVSEIKTEITSEWILSEDSQPATVKDTLTNSLDLLHLANEKLIQMQTYCEAFDLELIDLAIFVEVQVEARIRLNLWENLEEWTNSIQEWYTLHFRELNIDQMRIVNEKILDNCAVFENALPNNPISPKLKSSAELFKGKIDIISELLNETLRDRHWTLIEELIDLKIVENDAVTIKDFEEANVFEERIARKLGEISVQARAEQDLEQQLTSIENFWMRFYFKLGSYRYHRNIFVLENVDDVAMHLDDSFVKMSLIRSSRHVEPTRDRVEKWIIHLNIATDTLAEWTLCQANWRRFEYLFSLPGIEFKIPDQLRLFEELNAIWKEIMLEVNENSLALVALLRTGRLNVLKECNKRIQELSKRIDDYLNTRRLNFPRLYFLSNVELMSILTEEPKNLQKVGRFLSKIFDSVFQLAVKRKEFECLLEPVYSVTHVVSERGEEVKLEDEVKIEGSTDQWLKVLEMEMVNTVKWAMKRGWEKGDLVEGKDGEENGENLIHVILERF